MVTRIMQKHRSSARRLPAAALACVVAAAGGRADAQMTAAGYLPDDRCATCHREIYDAYQKVGMARSFARPRPDRIIEDFENNHFYHAPSRRHYEMLYEDGAFGMRRYQLDEQGRRINVLEQSIDWIIGSGEHSRGYLYQTALGELYELPIVWYSQTGAWGMAPGYDNADHDGVTRRITRECMFCHNAYPPVAPGSDTSGRPPLFPKDLPQGTGCQRCHGPGAEHVRLANDMDAALDDVITSIINPARLPPVRRDDVCYQCHLQPTSRRTSLVRRSSRAGYSYRPGDSLAEYLVHLDFGDATDRAERFEINHHAYRLRQSACFRAAGSALSCLTCHDPHRKVAPAEVQAHYRRRCLSCHGPDDCRLEEMTARPETAADHCITCHMPRRRTQDVVHVVMTDHRITRTPPADPLAALAETPLPTDQTIGFYFPDRAPQDVEAAIYRGLSGAADGVPAGVRELRDAVSTLPAGLDPYLTLGAVQLAAGRYRQALNTFTLLQARAPGSAIALANLGVALAGLGENPSAITPLTEALDLDTNIPDTHFNLAAVLARIGRGDEAVGHYREALSLRPNYAKAWFNMGNVLARDGLYEEASESYRQALAIEPGMAAAYGNLGTALHYQDKLDEAMTVWLTGLSVPASRGRTALELAIACLVTSPRPDRCRDAALRYARAAVDETPDDPRAVTALAVAHLLNEQTTEASEVAFRAGRLGADVNTINLIVALTELQQERVDLARALYDRVREAVAGLRPSRARDSLLEYTGSALGPQ